MVASIFTILKYVTHLEHPRGKKGQKMGVNLSISSQIVKNQQIWSNVILKMRNFMVASIFTILKYFTHLGHPKGKNGHKMG